MAHLKRIAIIGSTGSIGRQTLEVIRTFPNHFQAVALAAAHDSVLLGEQIMEFEPSYVYCRDKPITTSGVTPVTLEEISTLPEADLMVIAPSGISGLKPVYWAAVAGKKMALANKESLVMAGALINDRIRHSGGSILPVDSEHSAIWQCLKAERKSLYRILLTASGGPFLSYSLTQLEKVTPAQTLKHPSWMMGPKVTVDSATLLNKGLEVIEAHHLFGVSYNRIEVLVHPPSLVHSMVEFVDGSIKAQMSCPDMRLPIQYALSYPDRLNNPSLSRMDWAAIKDLPFEEPDTTAFPCLKLAVEAGRMGSTYPAVLCGAGEASVEMFLANRILFTDIARIIEKVLNAHKPQSKPDLDCIEAAAFEGQKQAFEAAGVGE